MMLYKKETISDDGRIKVEKITTSEDYLVHKHEFIELVYIMAGGGSQIINGSSRAVIQTARCFTSTLRRYTGSLPEVSGGKSRNSLREAVDLEFYTHDLSAGALPNDDLDLQLSWLCAAERYGTAVDAKILAEYWVSTIVPNWAEYGVGKTNLRLGLEPPLAGGFCNAFKDSNGAWIRSEIWACLMPGHPELAVRYAYQDAIVDHADEGVYAEVFTAALESAAFVESDYEELVHIGLSYIPEDCGVAKAVKLAIECYKSGITWKEARIRLLNEIPGSFGGQVRTPNPDNIPQGPWGYDAPSNIGLTIIGWYYGEGDFSRSICIAAGCGEDGDCTTATLGSIMGIILGASGLPQKWLEPIGDEMRQEN